MSVQASGTITDVGETNNNISYVLASTTRETNYNIILDPGTLKITAKMLTIPSNHGWSTVKPGTAQWVAVTRENLTVFYKLNLYRIGDTSNTKVGETTVLAGATEYDFTDMIKNDAAAQTEAAGYCYTIQAFPEAGTSKNNYAESGISADSSILYTAKITIIKGAGVSEAVFDGDKTTGILLQGERVSVEATPQTGYVLHPPIWTADSDKISFAAASQATTQLKISNTLAEPLTAQVRVRADDVAPTITEFSATANEAKNQITFTLKASDAKGLTGWMLTTSSESPEATDAGWINIEKSVSIEKQSTVTEANSYYAWVRDDGGNITGSVNPLAVYQINFVAGDEAATGSMNSILKVQNTAVELPTVAFSKDGYTFKNWRGNNTQIIFANGGSYAANASDTKTAQWTNEQFSYEVQYFYMKTDGSYPQSADTTASFKAAYNAVVNSNDAGIQVPRSGMELDASKADSVTITDTDKVLKVYYKRNQYKITYSYKKPGELTDTIVEKNHYYGATVSEITKPTAEGYTFVGWLFGESGTCPVTMPNQDISATGSFWANDTVYQVKYFEKELNGNGYKMVPELSEVKNASSGQLITAATSGTADIVAKEIEGFRVTGVIATQGAAGSENPASEPVATSDSGTVSANQLYINFYYARNEYDLTLNVWKGERSSTGNRLYQKVWENIPYGTPISVQDYETYDKDKWLTGQTGMEKYELAEEADWSTGEKPASMPAGNVVVSRDYILTTISTYQVEVYYENTAGTYDRKAALTYYAAVDTDVTLGDNNSTATIKYDELGSVLNDFEYYHFSEGNTNNVLGGKVTDSSKGADLALKVYFDRDEVSPLSPIIIMTGQTVIPR